MVLRDQDAYLSNTVKIDFEVGLKRPALQLS
jgi:hypothetical protein